MRAADSWKDYELMDASDGERLERWGDIVLIRPDPQVIWSKKRGGMWEKAHAVYHRSNAGGGCWETLRPIPEVWSISYRDLSFNLKPMGFKHTGLFPEQAVNWDFMRKKIKDNGGKANILNLFAYTGGATLACAKERASVCHVDAAKGMVAWAKENAAAAGLGGSPIRYIVDDCLKFVQREGRRGSRYDGIVMDPPSYGRGPGGEVWKLEDKLFELVGCAAELLSDEPLFFIINSYTTGVSPSVMEYLLNTVIVPKLGGSVSSDEIGLPVKESGFVLPCGSAAIWEKA